MFEKYGFSLHQLGWNIIPVHEKRPLIPYWSQYSDIPPTNYEIEKWSNKFSTANIGLVLGGFSDVIALDIDIDDPWIVQQIRLVADDILGASPITRFGRAPRLVNLYRGSHIKTSVGPLEFLSTGRQVVIFGQHPLTKKQYYYEDFTPLNCEPMDLPLLKVNQVQEFKEIVKVYLPKRSINNHTNGTGDTDFFENLKDSRKAKDAHERRIAICNQLQGAEPGNLHNTLLSCIAALAHDGCSQSRIKQIVDKNFNAPRTGVYSEDWENLDRLISQTIKKFGHKNDIQRTQ